MSYQTPNTSWSDSDVPTPADFNRMEGNTEYLKDAVDSNYSDILSNASSITSVASDLTSANTSLDGRLTVLEGTGSIQGVGTSDTVYFGTVSVTANVFADNNISADGALTSIGNVTSTTGDVSATAGDLSASNGDVNAKGANIGTDGLAMMGPIIPYQTSSGSWSIGPGSAQTPGAGTYIIAQATGMEMQINVSGSWRYFGNGGVFITYGGNVRVYNAGGNTITVYYQKY